MNSSDELVTARDRISRLFQFVRDWNQLRNPIQYHIDELRDWSEHLNDLPQHPSVVLGSPPSRATTDETQSGDVSAFVLRVDRPELEPVPEPPALIRDWLQRGWDDHDKIATAIQTRLGGDLEGAATERFEDDPDRVEAFTAWNASREEFIEAQRPARQAFHLFERLYELHGTLEREAERYEILLGDGILCWQVPSGSIRFPILLQRLELEFDPAIPRFTLSDANRPTEFNSSVLRSVTSVEGSVIAGIKDELAANQFHPLMRDELTAFLKSIPPRLAPAGKFVEAPPPTDTLDPTLYRDPLVFLRRRTSGIADALDKIVEDVELGGELPKSLVNIVGIGENAADLGSTGAGETGLNAPAEAAPPDILFTKPSNEEQYRIADSLQSHSCVVVQGPPGTGKTHTIANLLGHLLAQGKSVLVTSATTKALRVLRDKVVPKLQPLCVALLESDALSQAQFKASVDGILDRTSSNVGTLEAKERKFTQRREHAIRSLYEVRQHLVDARLADTQPVILAGESVEALTAAKTVAQGADVASWIPPPVPPTEPLSLTGEEARALYRTNETVPASVEKELSARLPELAAIPDPNAFTLTVRTLLATAIDDLPHKECWANSQADASEIRDLLRSVCDLTTLWESADEWLFAIGTDGFRGGGHVKTWSNLFAEIDNLENIADRARDTLVRFEPRLAPDKDPEQQHKILEEIVAHLQSGKSLGFFVLMGRPVWKSLASTATVNGQPPRTLQDFEALLMFAALTLARRTVTQRWSRQVLPISGPLLPDDSPENAAGPLLRQARTALRWYGDALIPFGDRLASAGFPWDEARASSHAGATHAQEFRALIRLCTEDVRGALETRITMLRHQVELASLAEISNRLQAFSGETVGRLAAAVALRSVGDYEIAYHDFVRLVNFARELDLRRSLLTRLAAVAPAWADAIAHRRPPHDKSDPPGDVLAAWRWRQLDQQLTARDAASIETLDQEVFDKTNAVQDITADLADARAWLAQRRRIGLDEQQALVGYALAIKRIGKGMGKAAPRLKRHARELMDKAKTAVPVWIMPLVRVAESYDPRSTKFDVVIIDEASQSDITGLIALYYGRQILVVGDDEQVSPSAVGEKTDDIDSLIKQYLYAIPMAPLFGGKQSIYDLAKAAFGGTIVLREHFRCVPDIIQYSNHYNYEDKMVLLREASESALLPNVVAHRVEGWSDEKTNPIEADEIVALILACDEQPEYKGKTFGVISLVGDEQARIIETLLHKHLEPRLIEERRLLCGNSAQFQGDERDVIFLSMVDSPKGGPLPLRQELRFKQRFNVAASRARDQMWLVYSLDPAADLKKGDVRRNLIEHAIDPRALAKQIEIAQSKAQSDFERDVLRRLITAGYKTAPQYAIGGYNIDIMVQGAGGRRLAVECDGEQYHTLLDLEHDLDRQRLLERAGGLTFHRIRGASYYRDPDAAIQRLTERLSQLEIEPILDSSEPESLISHELKMRVLVRANELRAEIAEGHDYDYYRKATKTNQKQGIGTKDLTPTAVDVRAGPHVDTAGLRTTPPDTSEQSSSSANLRNPPEKSMPVHFGVSLNGNGEVNTRASSTAPDSSLRTEQRPPPIFQQSHFFEPTQDNLRLDRKAPAPSNETSKTGERVRMKPINETLHLRKETKGTYVFECDDPNAAITTLYVRKDAFANKAAPAKLSLTIEEPELS